jgi:hypothetical protein
MTNNNINTLFKKNIKTLIEKKAITKETIWKIAVQYDNYLKNKLEKFAQEPGKPKATNPVPNVAVNQNTTAKQVEKDKEGFLSTYLNFDNIVEKIKSYISNPYARSALIGALLSLGPALLTVDSDNSIWRTLSKLLIFSAIGAAFGVGFNALYDLIVNPQNIITNIANRFGVSPDIISKFFPLKSPDNVATVEEFKNRAAADEKLLTIISDPKTGKPLVTLSGKDLIKHFASDNFLKQILHLTKGDYSNSINILLRHAQNSLKDPKIVNHIIATHTSPEQAVTGDRTSTEQNVTGANTSPEQNVTGANTSPEQAVTGDRTSPEQNVTGANTSPEQAVTGNAVVIFPNAPQNSLIIPSNIPKDIKDFLSLKYLSSDASPEVMAIPKLLANYALFRPFKEHPYFNKIIGPELDAASYLFNLIPGNDVDLRKSVGDFFSNNQETPNFNLPPAIYVPLLLNPALVANVKLLRRALMHSPDLAKFILNTTRAVPVGLRYSAKNLNNLMKILATPYGRNYYLNKLNILSPTLSKLNELGNRITTRISDFRHRNIFNLDKKFNVGANSSRIAEYDKNVLQALIHDLNKGKPLFQIIQDSDSLFNKQLKKLYDEFNSSTTPQSRKDEIIKIFNNLTDRKYSSSLPNYADIQAHLISSLGNDRRLPINRIIQDWYQNILGEKPKSIENVDILNALAASLGQPTAIKKTFTNPNSAIFKLLDQHIKTFNDPLTPPDQRKFSEYIIKTILGDAALSDNSPVPELINKYLFNDFISNPDLDINNKQLAKLLLPFGINPNEILTQTSKKVHLMAEKMLKELGYKLYRDLARPNNYNKPLETILKSEESHFRKFIENLLKNFNRGNKPFDMAVDALFKNLDININDIKGKKNLSNELIDLVLKNTPKLDHPLQQIYIDRARKPGLATRLVDFFRPGRASIKIDNNLLQRDVDRVVKSTLPDLLLETHLTSKFPRFITENLRAGHNLVLQELAKPESRGGAGSSLLRRGIGAASNLLDGIKPKIKNITSPEKIWDTGKGLFLPFKNSRLANATFVAGIPLLTEIFSNYLESQTPIDIYSKQYLEDLKKINTIENARLGNVINNK